MWQLLLTISILAATASVLVQRAILRDVKVNPVVYTIVTQLLTSVVITVYVLLKGPHFTNLHHLIPNFALMVILLSVANVLTSRALQLISAAELMIIMGSRSLWAIFVAILFLHEVYTLERAIGTVLILLSVYLVSYKKSLKVIHFSKGELLAAIAAMCFGIEFANDAYIARTVDVSTYEIFVFLLPALAILMRYPNAIRRLKSVLHSRLMLQLLPLTILSALATIPLLLAYQVGRNESQIAPLYEMTTVLTVIFSILVIKERAYIARKLLGACVSVLGVILLR
ncbi:MAG TPA: EamA family transporter [Ktedonobacteraceae bacterium]|nr:EamA family transporter [Ktedonobacteraceae bacterium]